MIERACHRPDRLGDDTGIKRGRVQLGVPKQNPDNADVDILLEPVRGKAVPQRVRADTLLDASDLRCLMDSSLELAGRNGLKKVLSAEQPALGQHDTAPLALAPPEPQQL
jgi:hypothetical protein